MESLTLTIESHAAEDLKTKASCEVAGTSIKVGRRAENDWVLPDATRHISGHHFDIRCEDGKYRVHDMSTNGTFVNGSKERIKGPHLIADGDRIHVGPYVLHAQLRAAARPAGPKNIPAASANAPTNAPMNAPVSKPGSGQGGRSVQAPPGAAFLTTGSGSRVQAPGGGNVSAGGRAQRPDFARFQAGNQNGARVSTPPGAAKDATPQATAADTSAFDAILDAGGPVDAGSDTGDQVPAPRNAPDPGGDTPPQNATPGSAQTGLIPDDDFTLDLPKPDLSPAPGSPPGDGAMAGEKPILSSELSQAPRGFGEPFADSDATTPELAAPVPAEPEIAAVPPALVPTPKTPPAPAEPAPEPAAPAPAAEAPPAINEFLEGFLDGAGIEDADALEIPLRDLGRMLGQCARMGTSEMMQMLQDRSAVKLFVAQEDRTMRIASGNNPMKFMMDVDEAFKALFVVPRDGYQTGPDGFENALTDIRKHQAAMMAAVQPAMADMLEGLAPGDIEAATGGGGGGMLGGGARKCWDEFNKRWTARADQGENGMLDAFVEAFARRYNEALASL